jgi:hypothetical protein
MYTWVLALAEMSVPKGRDVDSHLGWVRQELGHSIQQQLHTLQAVKRHGTQGGAFGVVRVTTSAESALQPVSAGCLR